MHKKRFLNHYHLIYVEKGVLFLKYARRELVLEEKDVLILPPYATIEGVQESNVPTLFYWIDFTTDDAAHFDITPGKNSMKHKENFSTLLENMMLFSINNSTPDFVLDAYLLLLLQEIKNKCQTEAPQHLLFVKICEYIKSNITLPLTVDAIATALKYNKNYLTRVMTQHCGISLKEYINKEKINLAKRLLTTSNYSVQEIAAYLGYEDSTLFTKFFKYHTNMSPGQYRNG